MPPPLSAGGAEDRLSGGSGRVWSEPGGPAGRRLGSAGSGSVGFSDRTESILGRDPLCSQGHPNTRHRDLVLLVSTGEKRFDQIFLF